MRQLAVVLLCCALFSVVLLTGSPSEAYAQDYSGQAVVDDAQSYIGTTYGTWAWTARASPRRCSPTSACTYPTPRMLSTLTVRLLTGKPATWCSSTRRATVSRTSESQPATGR